MSTRKFFFCSQPCTRYLKEATRDLQKGPNVDSENIYSEEQDLPSEDNESPQDESPEEDASGTTSDEELEQAPVPVLELYDGVETLDHLGRPLGLNDPDLYDTASDDDEGDVDIGIQCLGAAVDIPDDNSMGDDINEAGHCPEVEESAASVITDLFPGAAEIVHIGDPPFSILAQEQRILGHGNLYYPFAGPVEWDLARWLHGAGSMVAIDEFLKLKYVSISEIPNLSITYIYI